MKKKHILVIILSFFGIGLIIIALLMVYSNILSLLTLDETVANYLSNTRTSFWGMFFYLITNLGHQLAYIGFLIVLYYIWDKKKTFKLMSVVITSFTINGLAKYSFNLERPDPSLWYEKAHETSPGLPSGHSQLSSTFWGSLAFLFKKWWFTILSFLLTLLIAFSRLILTVHFLSDVFMGLGIGSLIVAIFIGVEEPLTVFLEKRSNYQKILLILPFFIILGVVIFFIIPSEHTVAGEIVNPRLDQFKFLALFITVTFSYILEGELVDYDSKTEKWWKYVIRLLIGLGIFALFYFGLSFLFDLIIDTVTWTGIEFTMDLVRYAFLGPILILLTPWIIQKLKI